MKEVKCSICRFGFAYFDGIDGKPICIPCFLHEPSEHEPVRKFKRERLPYKRTNPDKYTAHRIVALARDSGLLKAKPCEVCGAQYGIHAHHEDYSKPLDVKWLCVKHHGEHHARMRKSM